MSAPNHRTSAYFIVRNGPAAGQRVDIVPRMTKSLPFPVFVIGRDSRCHLTLDDPEVASIHAFITRDESGVYTLKDNDTPAGITLDGEHIEREVMHPGCTLRLGKTVLRFDTLENKLSDILREVSDSADSQAANVTVPAPTRYKEAAPSRRNRFVTAVFGMALAIVAGVVAAVVMAGTESAVAANPDDYPPVAYTEPGEPGTATVLYFSAEWCIFCPDQKPIIEQLDGEFSRNVIFRELDIDDRNNYQVVRRYGVNSVPRIVILDGWNHIQGHFYGLTGAGDLRASIQQAEQVQ